MISTRLKSYIHTSFKLVTLLLLSSVASIGYGQSEVIFGKNRVQYNDDLQDWSQYRSDHFTAYFYGKAKNTGLVALQMAEMDFQEIQNLIEHQLSERIELIVYTDLTDFKQSNLGVEEAFTSTAGQTKIIGNKMFIYFNGNHKDLHRQVREGIAGVFLNSLYFGTNLQDIVQNVISSDIPEWFIQGLSAHIGESWNNDIDEYMRAHLGERHYRTFDDFLYENPRVAGHSFWNFINQQYGSSAISNLLYLTRINRNLESAFLYVLGIPYKEIKSQWLAFYSSRYKLDKKTLRPKNAAGSLGIKSKDRVEVTQIAIHPSGTMMALAENEIGKVRVFIYDMINDEKELVFNYSYRNPIQATDYNFPLLTWNPNGLELTYVYEAQDEIKIAQYDVASGDVIEEVLDPQYDRIHSISYRNNVQMVISATVAGYSDLFLYNIKSKMSKRLTNDYFDDLDATYAKFGGYEGVLFSSNRPDLSLKRRRIDTLLPINHLDIYFLELKEKENELTRITNTPFVSERAALALDSTHYTFLNDDNGIVNRYRGYLDEITYGYETTLLLANGEKIVGPRDSLIGSEEKFEIDSSYTMPLVRKIAYNETISNKSSSIVRHHTLPKRKMLVELQRIDEAHIYNLIKTDLIKNETPLNTTYRQENIQKLQIANRNTRSKKIDIEEILGNNKYKITDTLDMFYTVVKIDTIYPIKRGYLFQSEFPDPPSRQSKIKIKRDTIYIPRDDKTITTDALPLTFEHPPVRRLRQSRIVPYRPKMRTDFVTAKMDNTRLFEGLDAYNGSEREFETTPTGLLVKANVKDILEDYEVEIGVRVALDLTGTEYFAVAKNNKKRLDKEIAVYRKSQRQASDDNRFSRDRYNILLGQYGVKYPLDLFRSIRGRAQLRNDKTTQLATDELTLVSPNNNEQRVSLRAEYVFDNTLERSVNILNGTRYKFYTEIQKGFDIETQSGLQFKAKPGTMAVIGVDARHYQRLAKHSILAVRAAGATSFGTNKILYYLGGTDNWLTPQFSDNVAQPAGGNEFAFQTLAANLRGFDRNIRNGNSYALINAELRVPIFQYLSRGIRSSFFKNFQVVGFADVGTAWQGKSPFLKDNPVNISTITAPPIFSIDVKSFNEPVVGGYGVGARMLLFGYFVRLDYAWGVANNTVQKPKFYLSLGYDF